MTAYYNEIDPNAAEWLRQLIKLGVIAPGDVDERSIEDVSPIDLKPYTQCHFFAGIGVWSYALRQAGWSDDRPVWTGSCPCQPFSEAGKRGGLTDERHLWPSMFWLIQQCKPPIVVGEQVASKDGLGWWDIVSSDLENQDYTCAAFDLCAAGVGAPHIRQRLFWVANSCSERRQQDTGCAFSHEDAYGGARRNKSEKDSDNEPASDGKNGFSVLMADTPGDRRPGEGESGSTEEGRQSQPGTERELSPRLEGLRTTGDVGNASGERLEISDRVGGSSQQEGSGDQGQAIERTSSPIAGFWSDAIWLPCLDGKARPAKPGAFPLVDGIAPDLVQGCDPGIQTEATAEARAMRLKGYGNAIVGPLAIEFISAAMEAIA